MIRAGIIIDMIGGPAEHLNSLLKNTVETIEKDKNVKILQKHFGKAKPSKEKKGMFSAFVELEIETMSPDDLVWFCFDYMPSSVEVIDPDTIELDCHEFTTFLNDLQAKLHQVEMISKNLIAENKILNQNALMITRNIIRLALHSGSKTKDELSKSVGIPPEHLEPFLKKLMEEGRISIESERYSFIK